MKKYIFISAILASFSLMSCQKDMLTVDDTSAISEESILCSENSSFEVIDVNTYTQTELAERIGIEVPPETKGISLTYEVVRIQYKSTGADGEPITLSMKIGYPKGIFGNLKNPEYIVLDNHYTLGSDDKSPYNKDPLALGKALDNALVVCPDYEGYGITVTRDHPYICHRINAIQSVDAVLAALDYIDAKKGISMAKGYWLDNYGYSQGGGIALAVQKYIETELSPAQQKRLNLKHSYCGGGPYSPTTTFEVYSKWEDLAMPIVSVMPVLGARTCFPEIVGKYDLSEFFTPEFYNSGIIDRIREKKYSTDELDEFLVEKGLTQISHIFSQNLLDKNSQMYQDIEKCLEKSDLTTGWVPSASVTFYHSKKDEAVPMENCESAYVGLASGNVKLEWAAFNPDHTTTGAFFYLNYMGLDVVGGGINNFFRGL